MKPAQITILTAWGAFAAVSLGAWLYGFSWGWSLFFGAMAAAAISSRITTINE
jgi:hypothetical protein